MYAAAGGASLASRQARQRQRQNKKLQQQQQQLKTTPQQLQQQQLQLQQKQQNKLYHNYTDDAISKLSRVERGALLRLPQPHQHERRHSASNYNLKDPISSGSGVGGVISGALTTTNRLKGSPSISIPVQQSHHRLIENHVTTTTTNAVSTSSLQLPQILLPLPGEGGNKLERRCSFVRQVEEELERSQQQNQQQENVGLLDRCHHLSNFEIKESFYQTNTDLNTKEIFGSLDYPFSECSQGRAAWQERERERRCSLTDDPYQHRLKQSEAHHRWMKRNRIHDLSYGGDSEDYDFFSIYYQSAAANALLYVGLGTIAIGSVIFFVGTGEKGFKTVELRLIGPTMVACGFLCCLIRVLLCACPASTCFQRHQQQNRRKKKRKTRLDDELCTHQSTHKYPSSSKSRQHIEFPTDNSTSLLLDRQTNNNNNSKKRVSIVPPQPPNDNKDNNINNNKNTGAISNIFIPKINLPKTNNSSNSSNNNNDNNDNKQSSTIQICDDDDDNDDIINIELDDDDDDVIVDNIIDNTNDIQSISSIESICNDNNDNRTNINDNRTEQDETYLKVIIENNSDDNNIICSDNTSNNGLGDGNCGASCTNLDNDNKIITHSGIVLSPLQLQQ